VFAAPIRVRYAETDQMGFAYYANYLAWFEVGRCEWLRSLGWSYRDLEARDGIMLPVIEAQCEYRQPARYDDELLIRARGELASAVRIRFCYEVVRASDGAMLAEGRTVHASTDLSGRPKRLPAHVRAFFA
jgi:acyl-CoA thioester hydrolase